MITSIDLAAGATVVSGDGKRIGTVKEVAGDRFKVTRGLVPDCWLAVEYVDHVSDGIVQLILVKNRINAARVDPPS